jgi:ATP-dependent Clp protease ATP-binding subunit ClpC
MNLDRSIPAARRVVDGAQAEARRLGHNYIGTEHLLLALVDDVDGVTALESLGISLKDVRSRVEATIGHGPCPPPLRRLQFSARAGSVDEPA